MIDQLQVVPKAQVLKNNTIGRSLALALQKVSIPRPASAHRALLINHFLEQVILQNIKTIAFGSIIKLNPHNRNPPIKTLQRIYCALLHSIPLFGHAPIAPYENDFTIFELLHCIDFQARNFERQQLVQLDSKGITTQILERLKP
ncbi:hypothetical protein HPHPA17_1284 [Helicobacter pylori Hp A-17]|nr:hypothetical protein [Helicobacter pylori]EJB45507.1 hypothetical protein HPHPA17_1284 [Helicobacter pylori Hp A-17]